MMMSSTSPSLQLIILRQITDSDAANLVLDDPSRLDVRVAVFNETGFRVSGNSWNIEDVLDGDIGGPGSGLWKAWRRTEISDSRRCGRGARSGCCGREIRRYR